MNIYYKTIKKILLASISILIFASVCFAQKSKPKPDFSGTWVLDKKASKFAGSQSTCKNLFLLIMHNDPKFIVETRCPQGESSTLLRKIMWFTDGSSSPAGSKTRWKKNTVYRRHKGEKGRLSMVHKEEKFKLSKNRKTLTYISNTTETYIARTNVTQSTLGNTKGTVRAPEAYKIKMVFRKQTEIDNKNK